MCALEAGCFCREVGHCESHQLSLTWILHLDCSFCPSVVSRAVRGRSGVLEAMFHRKPPVPLGYELWTVISIADCWNTISSKVGACLLHDRGGWGISQLVDLKPVGEMTHSYWVA